jgi:hypothetical protein
MKVTPDPEAKEEMLKHLKAFILNQDRSGLHLSDLTKCITKTFWDATLTNKDIEEVAAMYFITGIGLELALTDSKNQPGEKSKDGIIVSPDFKSPTSGMYTEIKTTRMGFSQQGTPTKGWPTGWIRQMMGYAYVMGQDYWRNVTLVVTRVGMYGNRFTFENGEERDFWMNFVLPRKIALEEAQAQAIPPEPFSYNDDWECARCPVQMLCTGAISSMVYIKKSMPDYVGLGQLERKER